MPVGPDTVYFRNDCVDVAVLQRFVEEPAIEVAVVADGRAKGNVNVET
jgi:hypothetical protein